MSQGRRFGKNLATIAQRIVDDVDQQLPHGMGLVVILNWGHKMGVASNAHPAWLRAMLLDALEADGAEYPTHDQDVVG